MTENLLKITCQSKTNNTITKPFSKSIVDVPSSVNHLQEPTVNERYMHIVRLHVLSIQEASDEARLSILTMKSNTTSDNSILSITKQPEAIGNEAAEIN